MASEFVFIVFRLTFTLKYMWAILRDERFMKSHNSTININLFLSKANHMLFILQKKIVNLTDLQRTQKNVMKNIFWKKFTEVQTFNKNQFMFYASKFQKKINQNFLFFNFRCTNASIFFCKNNF
jgi:hypothetical protein